MRTTNIRGVYYDPDEDAIDSRKLKTPMRKICPICGKAFYTVWPLQGACTPCLADGGFKYAQYWNSRHPVAQAVFDGLPEAFARLRGEDATSPHHIGKDTL